ncbi:MAG: hypothetical protein K6E38_05455, partial [Fretibacterium sp.]|nr:hypothetical protein [Fretibacterium sp.]
MKKILCGLLLPAVLMCFTPAAMADVDFWIHHRSEGWLVADKSDYTQAKFAGVFLGLEAVGSADTEPQERALILTGGKYSYHLGDGLVDVDNTVSTDQKFDLRWVEEDREYVPVNEDGEDLHGFQRNADTGLNGIKVRWTGTPEGNTTLPNFISTQAQLESGAPYVTLTRNASGDVTGFTVSLVMASDPTAPVAVEGAQIRMRFRQNDEWVRFTWTDSEGNRWKGYEGAALTDTLSTPIPAAEFGGVEVTVRKDS